MGHSSTRRPASLTCSSHLLEIVAVLVEDLYDYNITSESPNIDSLLVTRMQLNLRLESWRQSLQPRWAIVSPADVRQKTRTELDSCWPQVLFSVHYYRCQMLLSRPIVLHMLRSWVAGADPPPHVTDAVMPVITMDFAAASGLSDLIRAVVDSHPHFLRRHAAWFLANYSGKTGHTAPSSLTTQQSSQPMSTFSPMRCLASSGRRFCRIMA